jgi:ATP-dependent Lhr-like helicase
LYISPLRALDADIHHNLYAPLHGISALAQADGHHIAIRHAVRTGDTSQRDRRHAAKSPPHLLITTPESLFVLLGSAAHRPALARVELVIVDELHAIADSKRGTHLSLSLERLEQLAGRAIQRFGLTATAEPLEALARLLGGDREVTVLDGRRSRAIELSVELAPRGPQRDETSGKTRSTTKIAGQRGDARIARVATHVLRATRSLVFVGSRALAERWRPELERELSMRCAEGEPCASIGIHHGALAKEVRQVVEAGLRDGSLKSVVATSSLELGIDIGAVDLVVQVGAPGGVARLLQRVGRAGHSPDAISRGVIVSGGGVDLIESAITAQLALERRLEPVRVPHGALDVLAQQLIAHTASETDGVTINAFLALVRRADPYRDLSRESLVRIVDSLASELHRAPRLLWDRHTDKLTAPPLAKRLAQTAGGTITSRGLYRMLNADTRETIGELDEEFVHESSPGDRFTFGLGVYRVVSIRADAVLVRLAPPGSARMPFWRGDRPMRAEAMGQAMGALLRAIEPTLTVKHHTQEIQSTAIVNDTELSTADEAQAASVLAARLPLTPHASLACVQELRAQLRATPLPTDQRVVVECYEDALGEPRIAIHCWLGRTLLEPWALALAARIEARYGGSVHAVATDNGVLIGPPRGPSIEPSQVALLVSAQEIRALVASLLPRTAIVGAAFREAAERSLLLPKQPFKKRTPLWMNRQRARDLLLTVGDDPTHPLVVESLREVMHDRWNITALESLLRSLEDRSVRVECVTRKVPSPFARGLETAFEADNLYEDDTPSGERSARRASQSGAHDGSGSFESPLELVGLASPADKGVLLGLNPELPLPLLLFRAGGPVFLHSLAQHLAQDEAHIRHSLTPLISAGTAVVGRFTDREPGDLSLEVCDAESLARLRRVALSRARRQIEPLTRRAYQRWMLERHRVQMFAREGDEALKSAVEQLAFYPIAPENLERDLLRVRVQRYDPMLLDLACARGEVRYVLLESPTRVILAPSGASGAFPAANARTEGAIAERIRDVLRANGALFFADIALATKCPAVDLSETLAKMFCAGELSNDSFAAARTVALNVASKPAGRWALRPQFAGDLNASTLIDRLLQRYGIVARVLVEREELAPAWTAIRDELDRREARGEIRRGEIVEGLGAVQFAHTDTIESLRASRSDVAHDAVLLCARDPAFVTELAGFSRSSTLRVVVKDGELLAVVERDAQHLRLLRELQESETHAMVDALRSLARLRADLRPFRTLTVERIDDGVASDSTLAPAFIASGFERDGQRLTLASYKA